MKLAEVVRFFLKDAQVKNRSEKTIHMYSHVLDTLLRLLQETNSIVELEQVTIYHLRDCVQALSTPSALADDRVNRSDYRQGRKPANGSTLSFTSISAYVRIWKSFFHWCYQEELIEKDIVVRLAMPKSEKLLLETFTVEHIESMIALFDLSTDTGFRDYVVVMLLLDTGMRLSELCALTVDSVHDGYVKVFGKGRKEREIGVYPEVGKVLWKYIHKYRHPADPDEKALFIGSRGPLKRNGVAEILKRIKQACGIENVRLSPHTFRHTFAKMYLENGGDVFKLSREMGHSDLQTTKRYLEDFHSTEARKDHASYSPIMRIRMQKQSKKKRQE